MKSLFRIFIIIFCVAAGIIAFRYLGGIRENRILREIISRLEADSRIAEVLVTGVKHDEAGGRPLTTIKFLEYGVNGRPLAPKYFTLPGDIIQFQSLVIRFDDAHVRGGDKLRGKSAYLFWKVFTLNGKDTREYEITRLYEVPQGYRIEGGVNTFEARLWRQFWDYALDHDKARRSGVKNLQIEAPGVKFMPGTLYTIKIEHDGGIRIDAKALPDILRGESIPERSKR